MALKVTKKEISAVEAYAITFAATAFGIYSSGDHQIKHVAWSAAIAVFGPFYVKGKSWLAARAVKAVVAPAPETPATPATPTA